MSAPTESRFPVQLSQAQRKAVALLLPDLIERLKLGEKNQRTILFSLGEIKEVCGRSPKALWRSESGMVRNSLRGVIDIFRAAVDRFQGTGAIPVSQRLYQFKITLKGIRPAIWRRIQVRDCTLDKLHEHIQTAMGWTNSHLHDFKIRGQRFGDPWLMEENFEEMNYQDSTIIRISTVLPQNGKRFHFEYEYDFGDCWEHDVLFEGCLRAASGKQYPLCLEGERACPPEDVGGFSGYAEFLEAIRDPDHEEHGRLLTWIGGSFDSEAFDPAKTTRRMKRRLPDWRKLASV